MVTETLFAADESTRNGLKGGEGLRVKPVANENG